MNNKLYLGVLSLISDPLISHYKSNIHIYIILITIIDEGDADVPSLSHYDDVTEHATGEMPFDLEQVKLSNSNIFLYY